MKKVLIAGAVAIACIVSAKADYLYWQATADQYNAAGIKGDDLNNAVSALWYTADNGASYKQLGDYFDGTAVGSFDTTSISPNFTDSNYSYYIELATYDSSTGISSKGSVGSLKYADIATSGLLSAAQGLAQVKATWGNMQGSTKVVPEPTSGLMMLVGMALLGLKRRRA